MLTSKAQKELDILIDLRERLNEAKNSYESGQVTIQIESIKGWIEYSKGNTEKAIEYMKLASKLESETTKAAVTPGEIIPAEELLADLYMLTGKYKEALKSGTISEDGKTVTHPKSDRKYKIYIFSDESWVAYSTDRTKIWYSDTLEKVYIHKN